MSFPILIITEVVIAGSTSATCCCFLKCLGKHEQECSYKLYTLMK